MDRSIDSIGSCSLDADSTDFSGKLHRSDMYKWNFRTMGNGSRIIVFFFLLFFPTQFA